MMLFYPILRFVLQKVSLLNLLQLNLGLSNFNEAYSIIFHSHCLRSIIFNTETANYRKISHWHTVSIVGSFAGVGLFHDFLPCNTLDTLTEHIIDDMILCVNSVVLQIIEAIEKEKTVEKSLPIYNVDRSVCGRVAGVIAKKYGDNGFAGQLNLT
jgi:hypothetical protein